MMSATFSRLGAPASKALLVALLALPALYVPKPAAVGENRGLAAAPAKPSTLTELLAYPAGLDAWINDHFGLRDALVRLNTRLRYRLFGQLPGVQAISGKDGRVFLSAYQPKAQPYSGIFIVCDYQQKDVVPEMVREINRLTEVMAARGLNVSLLVVPSAPVVQKAQLPDWLAARASLASSRAQAPSFTPEALPAVTVPSGRTTPFNLANASRLVLRGCSSVSTTMASPFFCGMVTGQISRARWPASMAATARSWLFMAMRSCASRSMPKSVATFSAVSGMESTPYCAFIS